MFLTLQNNRIKIVTLTQYSRAGVGALLISRGPLSDALRNCAGAGPIYLAISGPFILPASTVAKHSVQSFFPHVALNLHTVVVRLISYETVRHWSAVPWIAFLVDPHVALDLSRIAIYHIVFEAMTRVYWELAALSFFPIGVRMARRLCAAGLLLLRLDGAVRYQSTRLCLLFVRGYTTEVSHVRLESEGGWQEA